MLGPADLARPVARALGVPSASVSTVACERIGYLVTNPTSAGLYRFRGNALAGGRSCEWSLILKLLQPWPAEMAARWGTGAPGSFEELNRWEREAEAYASGELGSLAPGLVAPRLFGIERATDRIALWLEDVREDTPAWDVRRYAVAARQLGAFNARTAGRDPGWPWLRRGGLRFWTEWSSAGSRAILDEDAPWDHADVRAALGSDARALLRRIVARHPERLDMLDRLERCVGHFDAYRGNLLARGDETVALDWSFVGVEPVGAEASHLVCASIFYSYDSVDVDDLSDAVLSAYLDGLRAGGWRGEADDVRRGFLASALVRWATIGLWPLKAVSDEKARIAADKRIDIGLPAWLALTGRRIAFMRRCDAELDAMAG